MYFLSSHRSDTTKTGPFGLLIQCTLAVWRIENNRRVSWDKTLLSPYRLQNGCTENTWGEHCALLSCRDAEHILVREQRQARQGRAFPPTRTGNLGRLGGGISLHIRHLLPVETHKQGRGGFSLCRAKPWSHRYYRACGKIMKDW